MPKTEKIQFDTKQQLFEVLECYNFSRIEEQIFLLRFGRLMATQDIAEELGISRNTVTKYLKIIRKKIGKT